MEVDTLVHIKALQALMGKHTRLPGHPLRAFDNYLTLHFHGFLPLHQRLYSKPDPGMPLLLIERIVHEISLKMDLS